MEKNIHMHKIVKVLKAKGKLGHAVKIFLKMLVSYFQTEKKIERFHFQKILTPQIINMSNKREIITTFQIL
jgi:hypothetical protein